MGLFGGRPRAFSTSLREGGISDFWNRPMLIVFTLTTFISATLLFLVQPLFAKMVLPLLGGAPAVWNTAMLFFQFCLLGGYAFAHFGPRLLGLRRHVWLQVIVVALPLLLIPMAIPVGTSPPTEGNPAYWLLGFMLVTVGAPFFALSTTSPTIQHWLASSGHSRAANPYFLYIASNAGSLLALLAYPVVVEPLLSLRMQQQLWGYGYGLLALLTLFSAAILLRKGKIGKRANEGAVSASHDSTIEPRPTPRRRASWVLGAFIPSSLLLGVTAFMSSEVAAVPLLWIVPMALYLVTFILAFSAWRKPSDNTLQRTLALLCVPLVLVVALSQRIQPIFALILLNLAVFFVAALLCHRRLADSRPASRHLTEFYLWLSTGGMLGGVFNALLAPVLFKSHLEYPLVLLLACAYALRSGSKTAVSKRTALLLPAAALLTSGLALFWIKSSGPDASPGLPLLCMLVPAVICFLASKHSYAFTTSLAVLLFAGQAAQTSLGTQLFVERSFFGISKITEDTTHQLRHLYHGLTIHGTQSTRPDLRRKALIYYHDRSPSGRVLAELAAVPGVHIGVVGLGAGSLAAYAVAGQSWTFFEIDPIVARVAADPRFFTFLSDSPAPSRLVLGDARLTLEKERDNQFDLLVVDAYSSDAIPIHLITQEAFGLYLTKLKPGGALLCHVSNNYLDLEPVIGGIAANLGITALTSADNADGEEGRRSSTWMMLYAGDRPRCLPADARTWEVARACRPDQIWRDDFSSILNVMRWN